MENISSFHSLGLCFDQFQNNLQKVFSYHLLKPIWNEIGRPPICLAIRLEGLRRHFEPICIQHQLLKLLRMAL
ncbi:hypothetical protein EV05_1667 [Prochlorococcus sp. MIT 0601]|nr:hypothetical protein EV05_1667 [Prochlorococcus sp. MIT 0601]